MQCKKKKLGVNLLRNRVSKCNLFWCSASAVTWTRATVHSWRSAKQLKGPQRVRDKRGHGEHGSIRWIRGTNLHDDVQGNRSRSIALIPADTCWYLICTLHLEHLHNAIVRGAGETPLVWLIEGDRRRFTGARFHPHRTHYGITQHVHSFITEDKSRNTLIRLYSVVVEKEFLRTADE